MVSVLLYAVLAFVGVLLFVAAASAVAAFATAASDALATVVDQTGDRCDHQQHDDGRDDQVASAHAPISPLASYSSPDNWRKGSFATRR